MYTRCGLLVLTLYLPCPEHDRHSKSKIGKLESKIKETYSNSLCFQIVSKLVACTAFCMRLLPTPGKPDNRSIGRFLHSFRYYITSGPKVVSFLRAETASFTSHGLTHSSWHGAQHEINSCPVDSC